MLCFFREERRGKLTETEDSRDIYKNELDKTYFQHDMAYGDFKDLPRRTDFDYVILNKAFNIPKNLKYDEYQGDLASMIYKFSDKESSGDAVASADISAIETGMMSHQQSAEQLQKPVKSKLENKIYNHRLKAISEVLIQQIYSK